MSFIAPIRAFFDLRARHRRGLEKAETVRHLYVMLAFFFSILVK